MFKDNVRFIFHDSLIKFYNMCFKLYWLVTLTDFKMTNFLTILQKKEIFKISVLFQITRPRNSLKLHVCLKILQNFKKTKWFIPSFPLFSLSLLLLLQNILHKSFKNTSRISKYLAYPLPYRREKMII